MSKAAKVSHNIPRKAVPAKRKGGKYQMPDPIPNGEVLTDLSKKQWKLGSSIGKGGFGEIYSATDLASGKNSYVIKIEPKENGPLFVEMHFFMKVCKSEEINKWMASKRIKFLGLPRFVGNGSHQHNGKQYRFVVMEKFGKNLDDLIKENKNVLPSDRIFRIALQIIDVLEYIHSKGYVHADIKGGNLLLSLNKGADEVYVVDFGLASKYSEDYKPDPKFAHNGTIEFTSRDAHVGAATRRGDLEILGYNMLRWFTSRLPWEDKLSDCVYVQKEKLKYLSDIPSLLKKCFGSTPFPEALKKYLEYVSCLAPSVKPDYDLCRQIFQEGLKMEKPYKKSKVTPKENTISTDPDVFQELHKENNDSNSQKVVRKRKSPIKLNMGTESHKKQLKSPKQHKGVTKAVLAKNDCQEESDELSEDEVLSKTAVRKEQLEGKGPFVVIPKLNTPKSEEKYKQKTEKIGRRYKSKESPFKDQESNKSDEDVLAPSRPHRNVPKVDYTSMGYVPESDSLSEESVDEDSDYSNTESKSKHSKIVKRSNNVKSAVLLKKKNK